MPKIKRIESALPMDGKCWEIGTEIGYKTGKHITEIKDVSSEFSDSIEWQYDIYVNGKLYQSLVNVPVIITYFEE